MPNYYFTYWIARYGKDAFKNLADRICQNIKIPIEIIKKIGKDEVLVQHCIVVYYVVALMIRPIFRQHLKFRIRDFGNLRAVAVMKSLLDRGIGIPHCPVAHQAVSAPSLRRYLCRSIFFFSVRAVASPIPVLPPDAASAQANLKSLRADNFLQLSAYASPL